MPSPYTYAWQKARKRFLSQHPLCAMHEERGEVVAATVVDHIVPHRIKITDTAPTEEQVALFWNRANWQPLCQPCHDSHKQRFEKSGRVGGCTAGGTPLDPQHHWNKKRAEPVRGSRSGEGQPDGGELFVKTGSP